MPRKEAIALSTNNAQAQQDAVSEGIDAYELPKSLVTRLARSALPDNAKLQKDVVLALSKGSTVFINYLAATAHDIAAQKQHKSVSASDVLKALEQIEMGDMVQKLQSDLNAYRNNQKGKKGSPTKSAESAPVSVKPRAKLDPSTPDSASAAKGKEKATITIPSRAGQSATPAQPEHPPQQVEPVETRVSRDDDDDEEMLDAEENEIDEVEEEEVDEDDEADVGDEEELVDEVGLEEEELRRDAKGVEERDQMDED
ncbi:histone-fold-containing protein [Irpex rosettiformis]|uniref:Histone-fold-containing protein n=1 Tax=Irpex rosettiformis TaxID=378272 RepID=A0ACB8TR82_9APHY|nr:histone-fold-containing protein [Irpex rosettiformis]